MTKPIVFTNLADAINTAIYVEQLLVSEYQWITNRLSWLFISQSFCISAYTILATSTGIRFGRKTIEILNFGLPVFGIICCVLVGVAVIAAARVARDLAIERDRLVIYINENSQTNIPLSGVHVDRIKMRWTYLGGELPHLVLPWVLAGLWLLLMLW